MHRAAIRPIQVLAVLAAILLVASCGRQPAQDYAVTGTIVLDPRLGLDLETLRARGGEATLIMTVRSSPRLEDVVIQRRWENVGARHQFGLGKGRGEEMARRFDRLWVTAFLSVADRHGRGARREAFVGWTREPVAPGSSFVDLTVDARHFEVEGTEPGAPAGGWFSPSVALEATPPADQPQAPGRRIFSGEIDVDEPVRRLLQSAVLIVAAREDPESSEGELIASWYLPSFPLGFSLHQNHTRDGAPADVTAPRHVVAWLDLDGDLATTDDQSRVVTPSAVEPGADDVRLHLDARNVAERIAALMGQAGDRDQARMVASGEIRIDPAAVSGLPEQAALWVVVRSLPENRLILAKRIEHRGFPAAFEIGEADSVGGAITPVEGAFRIGAMLVEGDPARPSGAPWRATSAPLERIGARGVVLQLERE